MRAIVLTEPGEGPTLTERPTPNPAPDEVLVRVEASSLNGFDTSVAAGRLIGMMEHRFPVVLGKDFCGTVVATGQDATRFGVGDRVFGVVTKPYLGDGAFAEYVAVSEQTGTAAVPDGLDPATAGAIGLAGSAALDAIDVLVPQPGQTILISGATGGVGAIALQYAAAAGARVIATAGSPSGAELVRGLAASDVVDHTGDLSGQVRALSPGGVEAVVHLAGDGAVLAGLLTDNGHLASTLGFGPDQHPQAVAIMANPITATLNRLATDAAAGRLRVPIGRTYPLADVPAAFADFTAGTIGKLGITVA